VNRRQVAALAVIAAAWVAMFIPFESVRSSDQAWRDNGFQSFVFTHWNEWKAQHPYGDNDSAGFATAYSPELVSDQHDPHNLNSFWNEPWGPYVIIIPAIIWLGMLLYFALPRVALSPITGVRKLVSWISTLKKDDWFKIALIAAILLAAVIIAVSMHGGS
jgi:hypothetical protein